MLRYEIDPSELDSANKDLVAINRDVLASLREHVIGYAADIDARRSQEPGNKSGLQRFRLLVAMALQHGLDAADIADHLGITVSTVHRWAKGSFVPPQPFIRAGAMRGIAALLEYELRSLDDAAGADVPGRYRPSAD